MPSTYGLAGYSNNVQLFGKLKVIAQVPGSYSPGPVYQNVVDSAFSCCGCTSMYGMGYHKLSSFAEKADYLAGLYKFLSNGLRRVIYIITDTQLHNKLSEHFAIMESGCGKEIDTFSNPQPFHRPDNKLHVIMVDTNQGVGKYYDASGEPFKEPPNGIKQVIETPPKPPKKDKNVQSTNSIPF